jgi:four helix bundle protein
LVSISSNIAEGARDTDKQFVQFLSIALASSFEFETQLLQKI